MFLPLLTENMVEPNNPTLLRTQFVEIGQKSMVILRKEYPQLPDGKCR
jgi:hypothetical protein